MTSLRAGWLKFSTSGRPRIPDIASIIQDAVTWLRACAPSSIWRRRLPLGIARRRLDGHPFSCRAITSSRRRRCTRSFANELDCGPICGPSDAMIRCATLCDVPQRASRAIALAFTRLRYSASSARHRLAGPIRTARPERCKNPVRQLGFKFVRASLPRKNLVSSRPNTDLALQLHLDEARRTIPDFCSNRDCAGIVAFLGGGFTRRTSRLDLA
jgi:hypothetical protein